MSDIVEDLRETLADKDAEIARLKAENERLTKAMEPDAVGRLIYETWLKAANGPEWVSFDDLAHFAPDDRVAIEQIVAALRARAALTPTQGGEQP